jgi:MFS family permease
MVDKLGSKKTLCISLFSLTFSTLLGGIAWDIKIEYIASLLIGISSSLIYPSTIKLLSSNYTEGQLKTALSIFSISWPFSIVSIGLLVPPIVLLLSWRWVYYITSILSLISFLLCIKLKNIDIKLNNIKLILNREVIIFSIAGFSHSTPTHI